MHQPYPQGQRREEAEREWLLKQYYQALPSGAHRNRDAACGCAFVGSKSEQEKAAGKGELCKVDARMRHSLQEQS